MEREIREQPAVLSSNHVRYFDDLRGALDGRKFEMVLLAARGSSDNAAHFARYLIEVHLGIPVSLAAPSVITQYRTEVHYPKCLCIGISQSGEAPDVSEVLAHLRSQGHATLAVTNTAGSRLTREAEATLLLNCGEEASVAATKTYTASLLAIYQLVRALGAALPEPVLPDDAFLARAHESAQEAVGPILRSSILFSLARGYSFASAFETGLKLMECALLPCKAYSTADFAHGPRALAGHGSAAIVFGQAPEGLAEAGCLVIQAPIVGPPECQPMFDAVFGQWIALLAARSRGLDPDNPRHLSKITKTR
jgi:glucosamine--fructose-6-phosphate aminotransferase (isomerizing)